MSAEGYTISQKRADEIERKRQMGIALSLLRGNGVRGQALSIIEAVLGGAKIRHTIDTAPERGGCTYDIWRVEMDRPTPDKPCPIPKEER